MVVVLKQQNSNWSPKTYSQRVNQLTQSVARNKKREQTLVGLLPPIS